MIARREVWKYDNGQVWVGKYRNSQNLLHWHPDCELLYVERGKIDVFCERKKNTLTEGQALFVDSEQVHYMHAVDPNTILIVIIFDYNIIRNFSDRLHLVSPVLTKSYNIPNVYQELREILTSKRTIYGAEAACKVLQLMIGIFQNESVTQSGKDDKHSTQSFKRLLEEMNANYRFMTFEDAAAFMGMTPTYFSRYFHLTTGITFSQQLNIVRTDAAIQMIKSGQELSMTEIADLCGFGTIRNFNRIFKTFTGYAPRELPRDYNLSDKFSYPSDKEFNPNLYDCELIESLTD